MSPPPNGIGDMAKKATRLSVSYDTPNGLVIVKVLDASDKCLDEREYDFDALPTENQTRVAGYGLNKLLTDRTSEQKDKVAKLDEMDDVYALLLTGEWAKERVVGAIVVSADVEALAQLASVTIPEVQTYLGGLTKEERAKLYARKDVQELSATIRKARKEATPVSLDSLLS